MISDASEMGVSSWIRRGPGLRRTVDLLRTFQGGGGFSKIVEAHVLTLNVRKVMMVCAQADLCDFPAQAHGELPD